MDPIQILPIGQKTNNDNKWFQYTIIAALNDKSIEITKIKPFINKYQWKEINFLKKLKDCKRFETNNKIIALNVLLSPN